MKTYNQPIELIVSQPSSQLTSKSSQNELKKSFAKAGIVSEIIAEHQTAVAKKEFAAKSLEPQLTNVVIKTNAKETEVNRWDMTHISFNSMGNSNSYIEPNFTQEFVVDRKVMCLRQ